MNTKTAKAIKTESVIESVIKGFFILALSIGTTLLIWYITKDHYTEFANGIIRTEDIEGLDLEWSQNLLYWAREHMYLLPIVALVIEFIYDLCIFFTGDIKIFHGIVSLLSGFLGSVFALLIIVFIAHAANLLYIVLIIAMLISIALLWKIIFD